MTASHSPPSAPGGPARPRLEVRWGKTWEDFWEALGALRTRRPALPRPPALIPLGRVELSPASFRRAFLVSAVLHIVFVAVPLPEFLTRPPVGRMPLNTIRIEYDLRWTTGSLVLPPISPVRQPPRKAARRPNPGGRKQQPPPPRGANVLQPQTIVSNPPAVNHPRQTVVRQFALEQKRVEAREFRLPNMVIPPAPATPPLAELDLRRLRLPPAPVDWSGAPRAPLPQRARNLGQLVVKSAQPENLLPRLVVAPSAGGQNATPAPKVEVAVGDARSGDLPAAGLLALSAQPSPPAPVLELPESNLRARIFAGPYSGSGSPGGLPGGTPGSAGGEGEGWGGERSGVAGIVAPDIFVSPAGPVPPGPVIVGPGNGSALTAPPPVPESPPRAASREAHSSSQTRLPPAKPATKRAEELLNGIGPGTRPALGSRPPRIYTIYINMPNLSSQAGSWVLRFAELGETSSSAPGGAADSYPLVAPVPVVKVDPKYPAAARREHVEGSVFLYGVIRHDGTVDSVEVVRSLHELLDQNAVAAFQRWRFEPGRKNGTPVNLEVVVEIPFRLSQLF